ncbi:hypothetical protein Ahia01_000275800, partial [Argonauta hians]
VGATVGLAQVGAVSVSFTREMYDTFQSWALQNYGDSGKTKTVTRRKYNRIVRILNGEEVATTENSKFRIWVKAKGFRLGQFNNSESDVKLLMVPTKISNDPNCSEIDKAYKRVAMVEDFFDIIHGVHVEMDGRGGKHAGQKRTYRAIAETYAFLPREAVTRFLMSCSDCQKRMHLTGENNTNSSSSGANNNNNNSHNTNNTTISNNNNNNYNFTGVGGMANVVNSGVVGSIAGAVLSGVPTVGGFVGSVGINTPCVGGNGNSGQMKSIRVTDDPPIIDFSVPITQTYLNHMRNKGYYYHDDESLSSGESEMSTERTPSPAPNECISPKLLDNIKEEAPDCENGPSIGVTSGGGGGGGGGCATPPLGSRLNNNSETSPNNNSSINNNSISNNINGNSNTNTTNSNIIITTTGVTSNTTTTTNNSNITVTNTNCSISNSITTNNSTNNLITTTAIGVLGSGGGVGGVNSIGAGGNCSNSNCGSSSSGGGVGASSGGGG